MPIITTLTAMMIFGQPQKTKTKTPAKKPQTSKTTPTKPQTPTKAIDRTKAEIGQTFALGAAGSRLNFKVTDAWYSMNEPRKGELVIADVEQKLLTMRVEVQNPDPSDREIYAGTFGIKITGADNQSQTPEVRLYDIQSGKPVSQFLRPTQKVEALLTVPVTADGPVYKLFVHYGEDKPLVYDFRGKAKDKLGEWSGGDGIVKSDIVAKIGVPFNLGEWQWTIDEIILPKPAVKDADGNETTRATGLTYSVRIKNMAQLPRDLYSGMFTVFAEDDNGQSINEAYLYYRNTDQSASGQIAPDKELKLSFIYGVMNEKVTSAGIKLYGRTVKLPLL